VKWHVASYLSLFRIIIAPATLIYLYDVPYKSQILLALVVIAGTTDYLDGVIARKQGLVSSFGAVLDYTADKVFVLAVLMVLSIAGDLAPWITMLFLLREVLTMGMRLSSSYNNVKIEASQIGKFKTAIVFLAITLFLLNIEFSIYVFYAAVALALVSFVDYFINFQKALESKKSN